MENDEQHMKYVDEWNKLFGLHTDFQQLQSLGLRGELRNCKFRSVCWRLYLGCFPITRLEEWVSSVKDSRAHYETLKQKYIVDPRKSAVGMDITLDNPLSQHEESPWHTYFRDDKIKTQINNDVYRTFPEVEFFHLPEVRKIMKDVLFIYAKENPTTSYRQGMHELLAPFLYVLYCDHEAALQAEEDSSIRRLGSDVSSSVKELMDPVFLEHDAYCMFSKLLEAVSSWYHVSNSPVKKKQIDTQPFKQFDENISSEVVCKLIKIHNGILKVKDVALFNHLQEQQVLPQYYGIKYLRLLFGRQFVFEDVLVLWDAMFADSETIRLADYILVALLIKIRSKLLDSDTNECLAYVMNYPPDVDVLSVIDLAVRMKNNKNPEIPENKPLETKKFSGINDFKRLVFKPGTREKKSPVKEAKDFSYTVLLSEEKTSSGNMRPRRDYPADHGKELQTVKQQREIVEDMSPAEGILYYCGSLLECVEELNVDAKSKAYAALAGLKQIAKNLEKQDVQCDAKLRKNYKDLNR